MQRLLFFLTVFLPQLVQAQFTYQIDQSIPIEMNGELLSMPWAGGLNSAQPNTLDLNGDSKPDLAIYDRTTAKILTFLNTNSQWEYHPEYEALFPSEVNHWMLLRDFNKDGKKDLFTSDPFGIVVFVNTTKPGENLSWRPYHPGFPLLTKGFSGNINLKVNESDIPAIDDIDGDGDLDILNLKFVGAGTVEYHKNLNAERTLGRYDSMQLERVTQNFGGFEECECGKFAFGMTCIQLGGGRTGHNGGKALLTVDIDNDGDRDLLFSEEECSRVYLLKNNGTKDAAIMTDAVNFPTSPPIAMSLFPAPFLEDINFDGRADLLASPNIYTRTYFNTNFQSSLWLYTNTGSSQIPNFTFSRTNFLQDNMIDVGDYSVPAFADSDADGDLDMFIGTYTGQNFIGTVYHYENSGTPSAPSFKFITNDFANLSLLTAYNLKPQFADMNADGNIDLVITATDLKKGTTSLFFLPNQIEKGMSYSLQAAIPINFKLSRTENILVHDINQDGLPDILLGTGEGAIEFWKNNGPSGTLDFKLEDGSYLGLGASTSRQDPALSIADLDADGREDLIIGDQRGTITVYGDIRSNNPSPVGSTDIIYNPLLKTYSTKNLGGKVQPIAINLFNTDKPAIVVGNETGGIYILKNDEGKELPPDPVILLYPNPLSNTEELSIKPDRNILVQFFSILGQKVSEPYFVPANQVYSFAFPRLSPGIYIARFTIGEKSLAQKFIIR